MEIIKITDNIHRITLPYKDIFTTVLFIRTEEGTVIFDAGSFDHDAADHVIPAMEALGIRSEPVKYVFISHAHNDHMNGLPGFLNFYPDVQVISCSTETKDRFGAIIAEDGDIFAGCLQVVTIPGHTKTAAGLLDLRTGTLMTGDSLQLYGIYGSGTWGACIRLPAQHMAALDKLEKMDINALVMSHDYHPVGWLAQGKEQVQLAIRSCRDALYRVKGVLRENPGLDDKEIAALCNENSGLPTVPAFVPAGIRADMAEGLF